MSIPRGTNSQLDVRKVLVVDDQADIREALRLVLKSAGYATQMADSPEAAVAAAAGCEFDLIMVDMNYERDTTSGREGIDLIDRLRAQRRHVPIIAMTGWATIELAVEAMQRGAVDFVTKPWDVNHLLDLLGKHGRRDRTHVAETGAGAAIPNGEIAVARRIQSRLLPPREFSAAGLEFTSVFLPARDIGGDLYDFFEVQPGKVAFLVGDVSGKGLGAALLVANLQATIRSQIDLAAEPTRFVERINSLFFQATRPEHFATLFLGLYDARLGAISYVNCGHPPAVLLRANKSMEELAATAIAVGMFDEAQFPLRTVPFSAGDRLVVFSDGLSEARIDQDQDDWVPSSISHLGGGHSHEIAGLLAAAANTGGQPADDITVLDIRASFRD